MRIANRQPSNSSVNQPYPKPKPKQITDRVASRRKLATLSASNPSDPFKMIPPAVQVQLRGAISLRSSTVRRAPGSAARPVAVVARKGALRASVPAHGRPHQYGINAQDMALAMTTAMVRASTSEAKEIDNPENIVGDLLESIEGTGA